MEDKTTREILDAIMNRTDEQILLDYTYTNYNQKTSLSYKLILDESLIREYWDPLLKHIRFRLYNLPIEFYREYKDKMNWNDMFINTILDHKTIIEFMDKIALDDVLRSHKFTEEELEVLMDKVILYGPNKEYYLSLICKEQKISEQFLEKHWEELKYFDEDYCEHQKLSEAFIERHLDYIDWDTISAWQNLSEKFLDKYANKICWNNVYEINKKILSDKYVEKIYNSKDYRKITEYFVTNYFHRFKWNWEELLKNVQFSVDFLMAHSREINNWDLIDKYQKAKIYRLKNE